MNIIFTIASLAPEHGGMSRSTPSLCTALASLDVRVELVSVHHRGKLGAPMVPAAPLVRSRLLPCHWSARLRAGWTPRYAATLCSAITETQADLVHDQGLWLQTNHDAARTCRRTRVPRIVSPRGMVSSWAMTRRAWKKRIAWHLYQHRDLETADAFHATSEAEAESIRALGLKQPIFLVPNGVELPPLNSPAPVARSSAQRKLLFLGRIHPNKGLLDLVSAWSRIRASGWMVQICGPSEDGHLAEVEAAVRSRHLEKCVQFLPAVEEEKKWLLYRQADAFVLPSHSENFGLTIAEALASGVPVITTQCAPWPEIPLHRCGWWVEPNANALTEALRAAVQLSDGERQSMGARGRQLIETRYSWNQAAQQLRSGYEWLLHGGNRPSCLR